MDGHKGKRSSNPFVLDSSINWRDVRREEERVELEVRRAERKKPVHEQHTYITRTMGGNIPRIRKEISDLCRISPSDEDKGEQSMFFQVDKSPLDTMNELDRQNSRQLIESKREIFHLGFATRTRRDVVAKLHQRSLLADQKVYCFVTYPSSLKLYFADEHG